MNDKIKRAGTQGAIGAAVGAMSGASLGALICGGWACGVGLLALPFLGAGALLGSVNGYTKETVADLVARGPAVMRPTGELHASPVTSLSSKLSQRRAHV